MTDDICYLSAIELVELFRARELSPVDFLESLIARDASTDPNINAFSERMFESARVEARKAELRYGAAKEDTRGQPLLGVPVATKEKHFIRGHKVELGLLGRQHIIAQFDHPVIERLRRAGAVLHARTTTPEYSCATVTHSLLWGVTRNPWNPKYSPGGSSGGSGAALAAGLTPLATASDIAGSTRLPAAFTGTVGYKAPYGRIPGESALSADWYRGDGPMARTVDDTAVLTNVLAGLHPLDPASVPSENSLSLEALPDRPLRIALSIGLGDYAVDSEVEKNTREVGERLRAIGHRVDEVQVEIMRQDVHRIAFTHFGNILAPGMSEGVRQAGRVSPYTEYFLKEAASVAAEHSLYSSLEGEHRIQQELSRLFSEYDALICPTSASAALLADENYQNGIEVEGDSADHYWQSHLTLPFNISNRLPVLAVPSGFSSLGIPTGVQIVARPFAENLVFQIGRQLERVMPWAGSYLQIPGNVSVAAQTV